MSACARSEATKPRSARVRALLVPRAAVLAVALATLIAASAPGASEPTSGARRNDLAGEASPYLQMHVFDPVDWHPWGPDAFARARREQKPIFLSIGYSSCHWCHVMQRTVFSDPAIAAQMNASFVNVLVDREERPDVDEVYQRAAAVLAGSGGWPSSLFLTPEGLPFFAGTTFPPTDLPGRSGFPTVLASIAAGWKNERDTVTSRARRVADAVRASYAAAPEAEAPSADPDALLARAVAELAARYDPLHGGFSGRAKFPSPPVLEILLVAHERGVGDRALEMLTKTLDEMALGGIDDQLGGGFHRYATEPTWSVPHFEKMLYDNAQLVGLYARAHVATGDPLYARVAEATARYLTTEMTHPHGALYAAQDADVDAVEGASYVFTEDEVRDVLGDGAGAFLAAYRLVAVGDGAAGAGALRVSPGVGRKAARSELVARLDALAPARAALLARRALRPQPRRDEKILAGWNGLAIRGLADAGVALDRPAWILAAARAAHHVLALLRQPDGRLQRSHVAGLSREDGVLTDYAFLADGLLALHAATGDPRWLDDARGLADRMLEDFEGPPGTGFYAAPPATGADALFVRPRLLADDAVPSGNATALRVLLDLSSRTHDPRYGAAAARTRAALAPAVARAPSQLGTAVTALATAATAPGPQPARAATDAAPKPLPLAALPTGRDYVRSEVVRSEQHPSHARVVVDIADGWHVNANPPSLAFLIPTAIELVVPDAKTGDAAPALEAVVYPTGVEYAPRFSLEPLAVYEGSVEIPFELPEPLPPGARVALTFQACDATTCLRPETIELAIP